jgi:hypothetical protein
MDTEPLNRAHWRVQDGVKVLCACPVGLDHRAKQVGVFNSPYFSRTNEAQFRASVPEVVNGLPVLEVIGWRPGSTPGFYASAFALTKHGSMFSTHMIYCMDDDSSGVVTWQLALGHYDFAVREAAFQDLLKRAKK